MTAAVALAHGSSVNVSIESKRNVESCPFDSRESARAEDSLTVPGGTGAFRVDLPAHSAIRVRGWGRDEFAVTACKEARDERSLAAVHLQGDRWKEGTLEARAVNGPLTLRLPEGYRSGVIVESLGHGPVSCPDSACRLARRTFDDDGRRIELGDSTSEPVVRLSTRNGPVSIETRWAR